MQSPDAGPDWKLRMAVTITLAHRAIAILALALSLAAAACAGEPRPRIGLCLAGGGARGGAHVGVLKVLEELRVPVDCIVGTSIGSIVGGLYASGYSPQELDSVIASVDWGTIFRDEPPRQEIEFRRKEEDRMPYFGLEFGINRGKLRLASGLIAGQKLNFLLRELCLHTTGITDFDDLPIPFRAIAADLSDGSMVVLDHGELADALRASMSIPGALAPVKIEGRTLVDGGIVRNLPYDVTKAMGADVVIAVDVGAPVGALTDDPTFIGIVFRTLDLSTKANVAISRAQFTDADLILVPELGEVTTASFTLMGEAAKRGEAVARENMDRLRALSVSAAEYDAWRARQRARRTGPSIPIGDVRIVTTGHVDTRRIVPRVRTRVRAPLDTALLQEDLTRIYRMGEFQSVDFAVERRAEGDSADLVITAREKSWGPDYLRFGLALADHFDGNATYNLLLYHRHSLVNHLGAEWRNQVALGNRLGVDSEFYQPLTFDGRLFVGSRVRLEADKFRTFDAAGRELNVERDRIGIHGDLGAAFSVWGEARLGVYGGRVKGDTENDASPYHFHDDEGAWRASVAVDQLDDADFPRHGFAAAAVLRMSRPALGASETYERASLSTMGAASTGRITFVSRLEAGSSFHSRLPAYDRFELGGFTHMSGLRPGEMQGDEYALGVIGAYLRIAGMGPAHSSGIFAGVLAEAGETWMLHEETALEGRRAGGSVFLGAETMLGPVCLGYGLADRGDGSMYFYLGRAF